MALLSSTGRIFLVLEPVSGRLGLPRLLARLSSNSFNIHWDGEAEITVITTNQRRNRLKIIKYEISYLMILAIERRLLKVTTDISSQPFQLVL